MNKKLLFSVTENYKKVIEEYAKNNQLSCEYIEKGVRKEEFVKNDRRHFEKKENESTFRVVRPNRKECDEDNYLSKTRKPYTHYYFYIHDKVLGNMCISVASYLPFKITVYLNGHSYPELCFKKKKKKQKRRKKNYYDNYYFFLLSFLLTF